MEYYCIPFDKDGGISNECDNYAYMHSSAFADIMGNKQHTESIGKADGNGYVKICHSKKTIYLKYRAWNTAHKNEIMLSYINRCRLGIAKMNTPVIEAKKSNWFCYNAFSGDMSIRFQFWMTLFALILSIFGIFASILQ